MMLVNMKQEPDRKEETVPYGDSAYPYGLRVCLNDEVLKKLGIPLPAVGQALLLTAQVEVVSARADKELNGDKEIGCDLQITDMSLEAVGADPAATLWPDAD